MQTLQVHNASGQVTLPKDDLRRDGVIDDDFEDDFEQNCVVDRLGRGQFLVRLVDVDGEGDVPDLLESEVVQRAAMQLLLDDDRRVNLALD
ncbi:hypothetical protein [Halarchaeum sp. P4]|uniref:hypothetical protein n=1 Tax=Halarchaeum sp. P4 TaxID=3421639 RepID=UPI003EBE0EC5